MPGSEWWGSTEVFVRSLVWNCYIHKRCLLEVGNMFRRPWQKAGDFLAWPFCHWEVVPGARAGSSQEVAVIRASFTLWDFSWFSEYFRPQTAGGGFVLIPWETLINGQGRILCSTARKFLRSRLWWPGFVFIWQPLVFYLVLFRDGRAAFLCHLILNFMSI